MNDSKYRVMHKLTVDRTFGETVRLLSAEMVLVR